MTWTFSGSFSEIHFAISTILQCWTEGAIDSYVPLWPFGVSWRWIELPKHMIAISAYMLLHYWNVLSFSFSICLWFFHWCPPWFTNSTFISWRKSNGPFGTTRPWGLNEWRWDPACVSGHDMLSSSQLLDTNRLFTSTHRGMAEPQNLCSCVKCHETWKFHHQKWRFKWQKVWFHQQEQASTWMSLSTWPQVKTGQTLELLKFWGHNLLAD